MLCNTISIVFATWILLSDVAKYYLTILGIFCHVTSMVYFEMNNGLLTLNMGLAKKTINNNIV
jgi:hypothetical protein